MNKQARIAALEARIAALETKIASEHTAAKRYVTYRTGAKWDPDSANGPYGRLGPVKPTDWHKVQDKLMHAFKAYQDLLKKHGFDKVQTGHNFDKRLQAAYDLWDKTDYDLQPLLEHDWERHLKKDWNN
jgi:hypothetical protein